VGALVDWVCRTCGILVAALPQPPPAAAWHRDDTCLACVCALQAMEGVPRLSKLCAAALRRKVLLQLDAIAAAGQQGRAPSQQQQQGARRSPGPSSPAGPSMMVHKAIPGGGQEEGHSSGVQQASKDRALVKSSSCRSRSSSKISKGSFYDEDSDSEAKAGAEHGYMHWAGAAAAADAARSCPPAAAAPGAPPAQRMLPASVASAPAAARWSMRRRGGQGGRRSADGAGGSLASPRAAAAPSWRGHVRSGSWDLGLAAALLGYRPAAGAAGAAAGAAAGSAAACRPSGRAALLGQPGAVEARCADEDISVRSTASEPCPLRSDAGQLAVSASQPARPHGASPGGSHRRQLFGTGSGCGSSSAGGSCSDAGVCGVCFDDSAQVALASCGHELCLDCCKSLCSQQSAKATTCPFCRAVIAGVATVR
jgi:hypothetical protein